MGGLNHGSFLAGKFMGQFLFYCLFGREVVKGYVEGF